MKPLQWFLLKTRFACQESGVFKGMSPWDSQAGILQVGDDDPSLVIRAVLSRGQSKQRPVFPQHTSLFIWYLVVSEVYEKCVCFGDTGQIKICALHTIPLLFFSPSPMSNRVLPLKSLCSYILWNILLLIESLIINTSGLCKETNLILTLIPNCFLLLFFESFHWSLEVDKI